MMQWSKLRSYIRKAVLQDLKETTYPDDLMEVWARWACMELSQHTAQQAVMVVPGDDALTTIALPSDLVGAAGKTTLLVVETGTKLNFMVPHEFTPGSQLDTSTDNQQWYYWEQPVGVLNLNQVLPVSATAKLHYFRNWPGPRSDTDEMSFPDWMEHPFAYLVAAYAMEQKSTLASSLGQWDTKIDSGNPEHNPLAKQARYFIEQAHRLLAMTTPQDRETFYGTRVYAGQ